MDAPKPMCAVCGLSPVQHGGPLSPAGHDFVGPDLRVDFFGRARADLDRYLEPERAERAPSDWKPIRNGGGRR
jgi:hypothetical protein